ncbi:MAG: hypothetical protein H8K04_15030 [Nitrospira sp.]
MLKLATIIFVVLGNIIMTHGSIIYGEEREKFVLPRSSSGTSGTDTTGSSKSKSAESATLIQAAKRSGLSVSDYLRLAATATSTNQKQMLTDNKIWTTARTSGVDAAINDIIFQSLGLPNEAKSSGVTGSDLIDFVSQMQRVGAGHLLQQKKTWETVQTNGTAKVVRSALIDIFGIPSAVAQSSDIDSIVATVAVIQQAGGDPKDIKWWENFDARLREQFGIPKNAMPGASSKDLLNGLGTIQKVGGDSKNMDLWRDVGRTQKGSMGKDDFIKKWVGSPGGETQPSMTQPNGGGHSGPEQSPGNPQQARTPPQTDQQPHRQPGSDGVGGGTQGPENQEATNPAQAAEEGSNPDGVFVTVAHNGDGTIEIAAYQYDASGNAIPIGSETYEDMDGDEVWQGDQGGSMTGPKPEPGTYGVVATAQGAAIGTGTQLSTNDTSGNGSVDINDSTGSDASSNNTSNTNNGADDTSSVENNEEEDDNSDEGEAASASEDEDDTEPNTENTGTTGTTPSDTEHRAGGTDPTKWKVHIYTSDGLFKRLAPLIHTTDKKGVKGTGPQVVFRQPQSGAIDPAEEKPVISGAVPQHRLSLRSGVIDPAPDTPSGRSRAMTAPSNMNVSGGMSTFGPTETWKCTRELVKSANGNAWCYCPVNRNPVTGQPIRQWVPAPLTASSVTKDKNTTISTRSSALQLDICIDVR